MLSIAALALIALPLAARLVASQELPLALDDGGCLLAEGQSSSSVDDECTLQLRQLRSRRVEDIKIEAAAAAAELTSDGAEESMQKDGGGRNRRHYPSLFQKAGSEDKLEKKAYTSPIAGCEGLECVRQYVTLPDNSYSWHDTGYRISGTDPDSNVSWSGYILNMTSQTWITEADPSFPVWWHTLVVIVPSNLEFADWATLLPEFGMNNANALDIIANRFPTPGEGGYTVNADTLEEELPLLTAAVWKAALVATHSRSVAASCFNALNEVEFFGDDPSQRMRLQDDIKGYTWYDFVTHGATEPERIMEMPVAKACVRAMDTVQNFTKSLPSGQVKHFMMWGYSKFGSATWTTAAIDQRIEAIVPTAISFGEDTFFRFPNASMLQVAWPSMQDLFSDVSPYAWVMEWQGTPEMEALNLIVNPLNYMERQTKPKFLVLCSNDDWFDSTYSYLPTFWNRVPEPKSLLFVHAVHDTTIVNSAHQVAAFLRGFLLNMTTPKIEYSYDDSTGVALVNQTTNHVPASVTLHSALSCGMPVPMFSAATWTIETLNETSVGSGRWTTDAHPRRPFFCTKAFFVSLEYNWPTPGPDTFKVSTPIYMYPHPGLHLSLPR